MPAEPAHTGCKAAKKRVIKKTGVIDAAAVRAMDVDRCDFLVPGA